MEKPSKITVVMTCGELKAWQHYDVSLSIYNKREFREMVHNDIDTMLNHLLNIVDPCKGLPDFMRRESLQFFGTYNE